MLIIPRMNCVFRLQKKDKDIASFETFQLILPLEVIIYTDHREFLMLSVLKSTGLVYISSNLAVK